MMQNPYWDLVAEHAKPSDFPFEEGLKIGGTLKDLGISSELWIKRELYVSQFAWTVTDPDSVLFVSNYAQGRLVDPMAGTGYWGYLLQQLNIDVVSYDLSPGDNHWHGGNELYMNVEKREGSLAVANHSDRTLLLAWPPMDSAGAKILTAYQGDRVIYIGEHGGCTGDEKLHTILDKEWKEVACHRPVQWWGLHDVITVYDRK